MFLLVMLLTGLDVAGAVSLKEASLRRSPVLAVVGVGAFVVLALLLYKALELTSLTIVSLAWVVLYQVAVIMVDVVFYGVIPGRIQGAAIFVAVLALIVAAAAPEHRPHAKHKALPHPRWPTLTQQMTERRPPHPQAIDPRLILLPLPRKSQDDLASK